jgi:hypothetical protein
LSETFDFGVHGRASFFRPRGFRGREGYRADLQIDVAPSPAHRIPSQSGKCREQDDPRQSSEGGFQQRGPPV